MVITSSHVDEAISIKLILHHFHLVEILSTCTSLLAGWLIGNCTAKKSRDACSHHPELCCKFRKQSLSLFLATFQFHKLCNCVCLWTSSKDPVACIMIACFCGVCAPDSQMRLRRSVSLCKCGNYYSDPAPPSVLLAVKLAFGFQLWYQW